MDSNIINATSKAVSCPSCGLPAQEVSLWGRRLIECGPCAAVESDKRLAEFRKERALAAWRLNPPEMRQPLNWDRVHPDLRPVRETSAVQGVAMIGRHDTGKTRVGYWLLGRLARDHGVKGLAVRHSEIRQAASSRNSSDARVADAARDLLCQCRGVKALLIDDVGKGATTETADEVFFDLLDHRLNNRLLTHWTANGGSEWLKQRLGADRGPAVVRRLAQLAWGCTFVVPT